MPGEWITVAEAAERAGCSRNTIARNVKAGRIERRYPLGRKTPTLDGQSVEEFAASWRERLAENEARRAASRGRIGPPDDSGEWLSCPAAALMVGVSPQYLGRAAARGLIAAHRRGARWWFRPRDLDCFIDARLRRAC
jgi:excisionase family DNA binding protein